MLPKRILLADDNALVRCLLRSQFEAQPGLSVCAEAVDGMEAIEIAEQSKPDVIVLDLLMPQMNGLQAAETLRDKAPNIPIILFTMYVEALPGDKAREIGISAVVSKTAHLGVLMREVNRVLGITETFPA